MNRRQKLNFEAGGVAGGIIINEVQEVCTGISLHSHHRGRDSGILVGLSGTTRVIIELGAGEAGGLGRGCTSSKARIIRWQKNVFEFRKTLEPIVPCASPVEGNRRSGWIRTQNALKL